MSDSYTLCKQLALLSRHHCYSTCDSCFRAAHALMKSSSRATSGLEIQQDGIPSHEMFFRILTSFTSVIIQGPKTIHITTVYSRKYSSASVCNLFQTISRKSQLCVSDTFMHLQYVSVSVSVKM